MANRLWWWAKEPEEVFTPTSRPRPVELDVVELNVGGHIFTTTPQTLKSQPQSLLAELFAEDYPAKLDLEGRVFIDRSGEMFEEILEFLRCAARWPGQQATQVQAAHMLLHIRAYACCHSRTCSVEASPLRPGSKSSYMLPKQAASSQQGA
jgi:hypothetical protein